MSFSKKLAYNSCCLLFLFNFCYSQTTDSLSLVKPELNISDFQEVKINENLSYLYPKPKAFDFITQLPKDIGNIGKLFILKENLIWSGVAVGATAAIVPLDQKLIDNSREFGEQIGFNENHTYSGGALKLFPKDINSAIYRVGNGFSALLVGGGLLTYGLINKNYRAIQTSSELVEGLIASGLLVQPLKRITGRESPFIAELNGNKGGDWNPFPSFSAYQKNTPNYDAMPSGHLTTLMTTVTILSENYKEVKWIKPVGYGLMGLMSFEMMQSKVHWASDYPIAILSGYIIGKGIVKSRIKEIQNNKLGINKITKPKFNYSFNSFQGNKLAGISVVF